MPAEEVKRAEPVIQTYTPEHEAVSLVKSHNYRTFYDKEIAKRKLMWYPPFCKIVSVHFQGNVENIVAENGKIFFKHCRKNTEYITENTGFRTRAVIYFKNKKQIQMADYF